MMFGKKYLLAAALLTQAATPALSASLPPAVQQHVDRAKAAAGNEYEVLIRALCPGQAPASDVSVKADERDSWYKPPAKVFDNLYYVGQSNVSAWAIVTSGGIILVDALYEYSVQPEVVEGLHNLGLDPAAIRYVIVLHGHQDHFGGARYLQEKGARIVMSAADWTLVENSRAPVKPTRDMVVEHRQTLRLGDTSVDIIPTPGHTPGTLSLIFPVKDGKQVHRAAIWGGTGFNSRTEEQFTTYAASAEMFAKLVKAAKVDVPLSNHPIVDHSFAKIEALQKRTAGQTHPFATGPASQQNLLRVGAQCAYASRLSAAAASSSAETAPPASAR